MNNQNRIDKHLGVPKDAQSTPIATNIINTIT